MKIVFIILLFAFSFSNVTWAQNAHVTPEYLRIKIQNDLTVQSLIRSIQNTDPREDITPQDRRKKQTVVCGDIKLTSEMGDGLMLTPYNTYWIGFLIQCFDVTDAERTKKVSNFCGTYKYSEYTDRGIPIELSSSADCNERLSPLHRIRQVVINK